MEPSALLVPSTRTSFIPSIPRGVYANLLSSCSRRAAQQRFEYLPKHTRWFKHLNSCVQQPLKPLSFSLQVCACTLEGDAIGDNDAEMAFKSKNGKSSQTTARDSENGSAFQVLEEESENSKSSGKENKKIQLNVGASKNTYVPRRAGRYADRVGKDILVPLDSLKPGAILTGKVTNITKFGAFVDVGAFISGLIHVSSLITHYVSSVEDIVKVGEVVKVMVLTVNPNSRRLSLKLIREGVDEKPRTVSDISQTGDKAILTGTVTNITKFGVFVDVGAFISGLIHVSSLTASYVSSVKDIEHIVKVGEIVKVKVLTADPSSGRLRLELVREGVEEKPVTFSDTSQTGDKTPIARFKRSMLNFAGRPQNGELITGSSAKIVSDSSQTGDKIPSTLNLPVRPHKRELITGSSAKVVSDSSQTSDKTSRANSKRSLLNSPGRPQKGELMTGSIAKIFSSGVYVTLNQGHEGFLPASEVLSSGETVETTSYFRVGQQVPVRVLRTTRNRLTLTMRKQENTADSRVDSKESVLGSEEDRATSPFEIAFRRDKVIAKFLEEREMLQNLSKGNVEEGSVAESSQEG